MSLLKLADELEETARQTAEMVDGINAALQLLTDKTDDAAAARLEAVRLIITSLQGQDRIEQRCRNLARAVRDFAHLPEGSSEAEYEAVWRGLTLDELRLAALSGVSARMPHGEVELF